MCTLAALKITVCSILLAADWMQVEGAEGSLPAPSLSSSTPLNNVELFSEVVVECRLPLTAPNLIILILGRDTQPRTEVYSKSEQYSRAAFFRIPAQPEYEGSFICWYNVSRTMEQSGSSNSLNITIASVPSPSVVIVPDFIPAGRNYTVHCQAPSKFLNTATITLSFYEKEPPTTEEPNLLGSLTLDGDSAGIRTWRTDVPAGLRVEYFCKMEVLYHQRSYISPPSPSVIAVVEEAPVRLAYKCAGRLEMFVRESWAPVCAATNLRESERRAVGQVVCKELGCGQEVMASYVKAAPLQVGGFFMGPVQCRGGERRLRECSVDAFQRLCKGNWQVEIVCSAFVPPPVLSITGHGSASSIYVHVESPLEISCMLTEPWLLGAEITLQEVKNRRIQRSSRATPGELVKWELDPPVEPGKYVCYFTLNSFNTLVKSNFSNSVIVTTGTWKPPSAGLIAGALITTLIGAGILVYICFCRVHKEEKPEDSERQEAETGSSTATPSAHTEDQRTNPVDNMENSHINNENPQ
ncbi:hypothetical protein GJAV_G00176610 [Gymnothorax javanicus]|nr:hypothetical protein GJAV_G00176610 [Gymnothorax javanicus]